MGLRHTAQPHFLYPHQSKHTNLARRAVIPWRLDNRHNEKLLALMPLLALALLVMMRGVALMQRLVDNNMPICHA